MERDLMGFMLELSVVSRLCLYLLLAMIGFFTLIIWWAQMNVLRGKPFHNPDGSVDDWHQQKIFYGIACADVFVACPLSVFAIILVFAAPRFGHFILGMVSFWFVWTNIMTTATSLRFEKPKITFSWIVVFPTGALVGLAYIVWVLAHFGTVF
jgi:hypothetical protein